MALQTANQYQLQPDIAGSLLGGFKAGQGIRSTIDENQRTAQYRQLAGIMTDPMASPEQKMQAQSQLSAIAPDQALALRQKITATMTQEEVADVTDMARAAVQVNAIQTPQGRLQFLKNRKQQLIHQGFPTLETDQVIEALEKGDTALAQQMIDKGVQAGQIFGVLEGTGGARMGGAGIKSFAPVTIVDPITKEKRLVSPTVDPATGQATMAQFEMPEGFEISRETPEEERAAEILAAGKKEEQKLTAGLKYKPRIEEAVTIARAEAARKGEAFTALKQAQAAFPSLNEAVSELKELSQIATSTIGGKIFDAAVKQTGFGSTEGATARAKIVAIVDNQVLPLLKQTFGAAFTEAEGRQLKATFGDIEATPVEKNAALDALIESKMRDIETKKRETGTTEQPVAQVLRFDSQGNVIP